MDDEGSTDVGSSDNDNSADSSSSHDPVCLSTTGRMIVAASIVAAPRALRNNMRGQPRHHSDPIGRTCKYRFGGKIEVEAPTAPWGKLKYKPLVEPRLWSNEVADNPPFRRDCPKGNARALRDACELHVEVLRDNGLNASYRPLVIWSSSSARVVGPRTKILCQKAVDSGQYSREEFLRVWGECLDDFFHMGEYVPPGVKWNLTTLSDLQRGPSVPFLRRLDSGQGIPLAGARPRAPRVDLWLMDTGSGVGTVDRSSVEPVKERIRPHVDGVVLNTVNGSTPVEDEIDLLTIPSGITAAPSNLACRRVAIRGKFVQFGFEGHPGAHLGGLHVHVEA